MTGQRYGVEVRAAVPSDAAELSRLLAEAGAAVAPEAVAGRLDAVRARPDGAVLVATGYGGLSGLAAVHWAPVLHHPRPVATLSALVVDATERRHGIGRLLLKAASQAARAAGCGRLELAGGEAFCLAAGFSPAGALFARPLRRRGGEPA